jgi:hypothetical protein
MTHNPQSGTQAKRHRDLEVIGILLMGIHIVSALIKKTPHAVWLGG